MLVKHCLVGGDRVAAARTNKQTTSRNESARVPDKRKRAGRVRVGHSGRVRLFELLGQLLILIGFDEYARTLHKLIVFKL